MVFKRVFSVLYISANTQNIFDVHNFILIFINNIYEF
jgi:hypothetical protein